MSSLPRSLDRELLDAPEPDRRELRRNLREMAMLNRLPGGVGASVTAILTLLPDTDERPPILDVGTGAGDLASRIRDVRPSLRIVLVDVSDPVLDVARRNVAGMDEVTLVRADVRELPFGDGSMAVVHASLLLHHLDPPDVVRALREMRRVGRHGVVINDLRRSRLALAMTAVPILALARSPYTRHDGILSVRRAHTLAELDDLAADAGLRPVGRTATWWPRVTTTYQ